MRTRGYMAGARAKSCLFDNMLALLPVNVCIIENPEQGRDYGLSGACSLLTGIFCCSRSAQSMG